MKLNPFLFLPALLVISACSTAAKPPTQQQTQADVSATSNAVPLVAAVQSPSASANNAAPSAAPAKPAATPPVVAPPSRQSADMSAAATRAAQQAELQKKSLFFDFDKAAIKPEFLAHIQLVVDFMKADNGATVVLEGHADERGSSEYNLALGEKRANAVKQSLQLSGIPASKMQTVSLGEEKPRLTCAAEKCWQENRRVDFIFKSGR